MEPKGTILVKRISIFQIEMNIEICSKGLIKAIG